MKKIIITIKEKDNKTGDCNVNIKMDKTKSETEAEQVTSSAVFNAMLEKLKELENIK